MSRSSSLSSRLLRRIGLVSTPPSPRYKGALLGLAGGLVGTLAMGQYWLHVAPIVNPPPPKEEQPQDQEPQPDQHVISPLGQQHENGEGPTAALGRFAYELINHKTPGDQTRAALSEAVHWAMGAGSGKVYGLLTAHRGGGPVSGSVFGAALWLGVDEGLVPLLGLQDGPASSGARGHLNRLGAHLTYGAALGLTVWALERILPD
ncbi:hypothetical protein DKM44_12300 [Deinococcus irradiatisoli]|uniref:DUF1440 domain-containing protein n=1 Tax=Deinococcus irradiatisoli TaxID=2202254 RepID=A0A2Z3JTE0_9DEIO|nr:hypothetical protein [Deinococcus irradiatisoli]AWN23914.1 hypothetical protein DKM44_12300 [Deinococcus irradiatisoli]